MYEREAQGWSPDTRKGFFAMITLEVVELDNGHYGVQAIGASELYEDAEFDTREEAEEWIFNRAEQLSLKDDPHTLLPGSGQGIR